MFACPDRFPNRICILGLLLVAYLVHPALAQPEGVHEPTYVEQYRPQFHFSPAVNWTNDPNGLVYFDGEYHLFYQYNPFGIRWGHMSWGHAVSPDLVHWEHLPVAIPETDSIMAFSGSAVVDHRNTSGFGRDGEPPLVAIYTGHNTKRPHQTQYVAYSTDRGRTWTPYDGNPVIDVGMANFRDPKVFWYEPEEKWVMVAALSLDRKVRFYASDDLKSWDLLSEFGPAGNANGIWECPDLFELPVREPAWRNPMGAGRGYRAGRRGGRIGWAVLRRSFRRDYLHGRTRGHPVGGLRQGFLRCHFLVGRAVRGWPQALDRLVQQLALCGGCADRPLARRTEHSACSHASRGRESTVGWCNGLSRSWACCGGPIAGSKPVRSTRAIMHWPETASLERPWRSWSDWT